MLHIFFNYTELHRLKEAVFVLHMVNVGYNNSDTGGPSNRMESLPVLDSYT